MQARGTRHDDVLVNIRKTQAVEANGKTVKNLMAPAPRRFRKTLLSAFNNFSDNVPDATWPINASDPF